MRPNVESLKQRIPLLEYLRRQNWRARPVGAHAEYVISGPNFLGNRPMVEALLSRLRHYCHTVRIDGPSLCELQG
jgi:hypothetical protein